MDMQIAEFVALNQNTSDLIYNHLSAKIIYRKVKDENGVERIMEIKQTATNKTERVVSPQEMPIEAFDFWKQWLTEAARAYSRKDASETRHNVSIENMLDIHIATEKNDDTEALNLYDERIRIGLWLLKKCLTPLQRQRYIAYHYYGKTEEQIAEKEGVTQRAVSYSLTSAQKKIDTKLEMLKKSKQTF